MIINTLGVPDYYFKSAAARELIQVNELHHFCFTVFLILLYFIVFLNNRSPVGFSRSIAFVISINLE